jgi:hypothetical protein
MPEAGEPIHVSSCLQRCYLFAPIKPVNLYAYADRPGNLIEILEESSEAGNT